MVPHCYCWLCYCTTGRLQAASSTKLTPQQMQEMIRYGADKVFRSKDSSITDEDIDLILERSEQKTAEVMRDYLRR